MESSRVPTSGRFWQRPTWWSGAQVARALVQLHRGLLGHVPGEVEEIHGGGRAGYQEDGAAGEEDDEM